MSWIFWFFFLFAFVVILITWPDDGDDRIHSPFDQDDADFISSLFSAPEDFDDDD